MKLQMLLLFVTVAMVTVNAQGTCNQTCTTNVNCTGDSLCGVCVEGTCQQGNSSSSSGSTGGGCGSPCNPNSDQYCTSSTCNQCVNGVCSPSQGSCGSPCVPENDDCEGAGNCNQCVNGVCTASQATCGSPCVPDNDDCEGAGSCNHCVNGVCASTQATCGSPCAPDNDDCEGAGNGCNHCINGQCGAAGGCSQFTCDCPEVCQEGRTSDCTVCSFDSGTCTKPSDATYTLSLLPKKDREAGIAAARRVANIPSSRAMCNRKCDRPQMCSGHCGVCDASIGRCTARSDAKVPIRPRVESK